jgi:hypothetical protein
LLSSDGALVSSARADALFRAAGPSPDPTLDDVADAALRIITACP